LTDLYLLSNALWILGAALILATVSFRSWWQHERQHGPDVNPFVLRHEAILPLGMCLVATGFGFLPGIQAWERGAWGLVAAAGLWSSWTAWRTGLSPDEIQSHGPSIVRHVPWASRVTNLEPLIVLALSPALLFPTPARLLALSVVPVLWISARVSTGRFIPTTPMNAVLGVMAASVMLSLYATFSLSFSLGKVSGMILGLLVFWAVVRWLTCLERLKIATGGFLLCGGGLAVIALLGTQWQGKFESLRAVVSLLPTVLRLPGAEEGFNSNAVAGCLILFVPLQISLLFTRSYRWLSAPPGGLGATHWLVAIQAGLLVLTLATLIFAQSRGALTGLAVATCVFLFCRWPARVMWAVIAASVVLATMVGLWGSDPLLAFLHRLAGADLEESFRTRAELWSRAVAAIRDFPLTGVGMNGFRKVMPVLYPPVLGTSAEMPHAHNHLLQAALDLGILGLVAYVSLWLVAAALILRVYLGAATAALRTLAGGLGAGLLAHFVFGITDVIPLGSKVGILFWISLAMVVGLHRVWEGEARN